MDRKDYKLLAEAYTDIVLDKEFSGEDESDLNSGDNLDNMESPIGDQESMGSDLPEVGMDDMRENEEEKQRMVVSQLHTIRSHAHEIYTCIENGANIDPWMQDKITIANDYIVRVANAIMYRK